MLKKLCILLPLECDLNLVITSEASHVVNSCSFMGIILFPYFNSTKGVKKQWRVEIVAYSQPFRPRVLTEDTLQQSFADIMTKKVYLRMFCKSLVKR